MLTLSYNVLFPAGADLGAITDITGGATVHDDGTITAATDNVKALQALGGELAPVSDKLLFRVTAHEDTDRVRWMRALLDIFDGHVVSTSTSDKGFWGPTGEYEASWVIETSLDSLPDWGAYGLRAYLRGARQEALYVEIGGIVLIAEEDEIDQIPAALAAARAG